MLSTGIATDSARVCPFVPLWSMPESHSSKEIKGINLCAVDNGTKTPTIRIAYEQAWI